MLTSSYSYHTRLNLTPQASFESVLLSLPCRCQHCLKTSICKSSVLKLCHRAVVVMPRRHLGSKQLENNTIGNPPSGSPLACTRASPSSRSSNPSTSYFHLASRSIDVSQTRGDWQLVPAQPVLKIRLSLPSRQHNFRLTRHDSTHQSSGSSSIRSCAAVVLALSSLDILQELEFDC